MIKYILDLNTYNSGGIELIRTLRWFLSFFIKLVVSLPKLKQVERLDASGDIEEKDKLVDQVVKKWARSLVEISGTEVSVIGEENVPEGPVLFVSNHQGNFDIPLMLGYISKPKGFIAKVEIKKMFIIRKWMQHLNCIFIDRKDIRQSVKAISGGVKLLKSGKSMVIFPEGTRSPDGKLLEFKQGSMKLGTKSKVPVVPVTINGSKDIMPKGSKIIRPAKVTINISKPIYHDDEVDTNELINIVKAEIEKNLVL